MTLTITDEKKSVENITWQEFFSATPAYNRRTVSGEIVHQGNGANGKYYGINFPVVKLNCSECKGERDFRPDQPDIQVNEKHYKQIFLSFTCKNCDRDRHTFVLRLFAVTKEREINVIKLGQLPQYGIEIPRLLKDLLSSGDLELFKKGLVAESHGLGVGAFSYYRRVLDNQRVKLIARISDAVKALGGDEALLKELDAAKSERQFTKAVESIKHALPRFLFVEGHNPLTLLYDAVSNDIHAESDAECLDRAQTIRTLLGYLLQKIKEALASDEEVKGAVNRLVQAKAKREKAKKAALEGG